MAAYGWDPRIHNYRNLDTGKIVAEKTVVGYRDQLRLSTEGRMRQLATDAANGSISAADFSIAMRNELRSSYSVHYMLALGGREQMGAADWGRVGNMLRGQYGFLDGFVADVSNGRYEDSPGGAAARASLYAASLTQAFERGVVASYGMPTLPAYPGDGTTVCKSRCHCHWRIEELAAGDWNVYWVIDTAVENCSTCQQRTLDWSPLKIRGGVVRNTELAGSIAITAQQIQQLLNSHPHEATNGHHSHRYGIPQPVYERHLG